MILQNSFYTLSEIRQENNSLQAMIHIDPEHEIFKGHFPGQPVVPGVCMVQIIKELLEQSHSTRLLFSKGQQLKFLRLLVPESDARIQVNISWKEEGHDLITQADLQKQGEAVFKLSGIFTRQQAR